jgi:hypothetical protein
VSDEAKPVVRFLGERTVAVGAEFPAPETSLKDPVRSCFALYESDGPVELSIVHEGRWRSVLCLTVERKNGAKTGGRLRECGEKWPT